jgi:hypothetical protein
MIAADFLGDPTGTGRGKITSMPSDWATIEIAAQSQQCPLISVRSSSSSSSPDRDRGSARFAVHLHQRTEILCLPGSLTKNGRDHSLPIGKHSAALITAVLEGTHCELLFPARGADTNAFNGWSKSKVALDKSLLEGVLQQTVSSTPNAEDGPQFGSPTTPVRRCRSASRARFVRPREGAAGSTQRPSQGFCIQQRFTSKTYFVLLCSRFVLGS